MELVSGRQVFERNRPWPTYRSDTKTDSGSLCAVYQVAKYTDQPQYMGQLAGVKIEMFLFSLQKFTITGLSECESDLFVLPIY